MTVMPARRGLCPRSLSQVEARLRDDEVVMSLDLWALKRPDDHRGVLVLIKH
jgi:hypothetical protein